ncbi:MAG: hypothetical protein LBV36_04245 [Chromatiales bacterium]|jgi:hypothetical protein|nr:hypothetical protein [Chromatiales bacterium]
MAMKPFPCPKCHQDTIALKDKYLAAIWMVIRCGNCGTRLCAHPLLMTLLYFIYFWVIAACVFWAWYHRSATPLIWMLVLWTLLDIINIRYMPLKALRAQTPKV